MVGRPEIIHKRLLGSALLRSKVLTKVNSVWPNPLLLIALYLPGVLLETGLCICLPEKSHDNSPFAAK